MSNRAEREAEDFYEDENDPSPVSGRVVDDSYAHETRSELRSQIPVQSDNRPVEDPMQPPYSNSDQQLGEWNHASHVRTITKIMYSRG